MTQEIINKYFESELGQQCNELWTTSDDKIFVRWEEAAQHEANLTKELYRIKYWTHKEPGVLGITRNYTLGDLRKIIQDQPDDIEIGDSGHFGELLMCEDIRIEYVSGKKILKIRIEDRGEEPD